MRKGLRQVYQIGDKIHYDQGIEIMVIGYTDNPRERIVRINNEKIMTVKVSQLNKGKIRTGYEKGKYGEYIGNAYLASNSFLYFRWKNMVLRCYDPKHQQYRFYGGKGITVSEELLCFDNYLKVLQKDKNYNNLLENPKGWQIDKDLSGEKVYSASTIKIIPSRQNILIGKKLVPVVLKNEFETRHFNSICEASNVLGLNKANLSKAIKHGWNIKGWKAYEDVLHA